MARFARPALAVVLLAVGLAGTGCSSGGSGTGSGGNGPEAALGRVSDTVGNRNPDKPKSAPDCRPVRGWLASALAETSA
jgi:hypothetical protein